MRRVLLWALHTALESADLVLSGVPIPAIVAVRALNGVAPLLRSRRA
jgi:hypothetical protein